MPNYRRLHTPGATWLFTVNTCNRQPILAHPDAVGALRTALRNIRSLHPFKIDALVILPDHLHTLWTLPPGDADYALRWNIIKRQVAQSVRHLASQTPSASRIKRREIGFWQRRYWEHQIRDNADFERHMDYIHYNPVKHGCVGCVADWPYSTFHRYVRLDTYPADWAGNRIDAAEGNFGE